MKVSFKLNNSNIEVEVEDNETLLETLRERLDIMSPKGACTQGVCGLCTVLVDGEPQKSCLILTAEVQDATVTTIEGLDDEKMKIIRESFIKNNGFQCGFCTSAFLLRTYALLSKNLDLTREEIRMRLTGTLCRCTGYKAIVDSVEEAANNLKFRSR